MATRGRGHYVRYVVVLRVLPHALTNMSSSEYHSLLTFRTALDKTKRVALVAQLQLTRELVHYVMFACVLLHHRKPEREQPQFYLPVEVQVFSIVSASVPARPSLTFVSCSILRKDS